MQKENVEKNEHGARGFSSLEQMVNSLIKMDYIVMAEKKYRIGDPDYEEDQFYFQYMIEFQDNEQWILHHTTSVRDRIAQQQWHSEHIKRINQAVKKAYVVVPDSLDPGEKNIAEGYNKKITEKRIYSALDGVIPFDTAYQMIEHKATSVLNSGVAHAKLGLHFEKKLVDALNSSENLEKWQNPSSTSVGYLYRLFADVMRALSLKPGVVSNICATSEIPKLPSGGLPKTDVLVEVNKVDGDSEIYTFSCKRSSAKVVTVHEYSADTFSKVLNPNDLELKHLLTEFQNVGGIKGMIPSSAEALQQRMCKYKDTLVKWALAGVGGEGDPTTQWATHIVTVNENENKYNIFSIDEYMGEYERQGNIGQFGTPFQWTYPSGGKGKRIQLKGRVLVN